MSSTPVTPIQWRVLGLLLKLKFLRVFRSATLKPMGTPTSVSVFEGTATVRYTRILDRGCILWFRNKGRTELPIPKEFVSESSLHYRFPEQDLTYSAILSDRVVVDIASQVSAAHPPLQSGDQIQIDLDIPCDAGALLEIDGQDGVPQQLDGRSTTTFTIRKRRDMPDLTIRKYSWRQALRRFAPIEKITVAKNGQLLDGLQVDLTIIGTCIEGLDAVRTAADGTLQVNRCPHPITHAVECEVAIPLSFGTPNDEYRIVFHTAAP